MHLDIDILLEIINWELEIKEKFIFIMAQQSTKKIYVLIILLAAIVSLIFFNAAGWLEPPKNMFFKIAVPVLKPFQIIGSKISGSIKLMTEIKNLAKENAEFKKENELLIVSVSKLSEAARENQFLRTQLGLVPPWKLKIILADIIGFGPGNLGEYFLIDRGKEDGVLSGQAAIYAGGFLVGRITTADNNLGMVMALVDSASSVFAITEETRVGGAILGDQGVGLILDMVPPDKEVNMGEIVLSSGLDSKTPKGLIIGKVAKKISGENDIFQRFKIKPAVNYKEIERVFIILGNE